MMRAIQAGRFGAPEAIVRRDAAAGADQFLSILETYQ